MNRLTLASIICNITPFSTPRSLPVIAYGNGERTIKTACTIPNYKGMLVVECLPDLADKGNILDLTIKKSTEVIRMRGIKG